MLNDYVLSETKSNYVYAETTTYRNLDRSAETISENVVATDFIRAKSDWNPLNFMLFTTIDRENYLGHKVSTIQQM